ncbi:adhesin [Mesomycoplasma ovipneumoniae]|uniref:Adhesin n=1 Tax=Mesomycoplasma ovipneumoniae TaxID=29562 RepID=A0AAW6Q990_9BACT|nr:adhesin [Mesomycoplasma ovipneumoniae]MDF9627804.1 adhesin [Mesomycoplasma ovipneumoniae]MDO4157883.1 adhesin [Mesomycoplasma ovipneumoniae]MDO4158247.1 adhesin [Mesomycoplasma ovipneumoniae]MDO6821601.1 adhesin [Mesomycoplasma ovipneumoniae]MDO6855590.1 adhesin [Mesomycoplasma ovipneumoniae]
MHEKNKNSLILALTAVGGVAIFATTIGLVTRIRYTGENPRAELENLVSRIQNVAFKSDVFDDSTTYSQIKAQLFDDSGKLLAGTDLNKFISFYTQVNSKLRKFEPTFAPNKPFLEFVDLIPNDNDQSFELHFRAKHQIDNNHTAFSTIISKKVSFAQRSQFALAEFNSNLEKITKSFKENIQNLRRTDFTSNFSSPNLIDQKIASLTRVEDFAADINKSGTQLEAVGKISQYFPDFQKIINELNFDQNNSFPFKQGTIYNFSLEKHPGTNNFISVDSNSVPSFLVKAELTDDAKFELKNFNIEDAQLLEKIDLVPQVSSGSDSSQDANNEGKTDESGEKQVKKATYFADLDDILSKISLRKLNFLDFKVAPGTIATQTPTAVAASLPSSSTSEPLAQLQQVNSVQLFQEQPQVQQEGQGQTETQTQNGDQTQNGGQAQGQDGVQAQGTEGGQPQAESPEQAPAPETKTDSFEQFANKLTVNSTTSIDFLEKINKDLYKSNQDQSKSVVKAIEDNLLINPISLDFGEFSPYFSQKKVLGVDFQLDINRAKATSNTLEIPVNINLYSSFFGDKNPKLLKSKKETFEIKYFKDNGKTTGTTGATYQLDKNRQDFYFINSLPEKSAQTQPAQTSSSTSSTQPKIHEEKIVTATSFISKTELEKLIENDNQKSEELKQILSNQFQYGYDFNPHESMLKSWTGNQKFPKLHDFSDFQSDDQTGAKFGIKSLKSKKFFTNEHDVAAFYAYLLSMEPTEILEYLFEIAKSANLIDPNEKINVNDIKEGNIFRTAEGIKFKPESNIMGLDFNGHVKTFDKRGWISNLFLPKTIAEKFKNNRDDDKIFEELNKTSPAKIQQDSSVGTSQTDDIYKEIRENTKKINKNNDTSGSGTGILAPVSTDASQAQESAKPVEELVKNFYKTKTEKLTNLKDLLLAFYVKAKELNNFRGWAKVSSDLDYQLVFEKQTGAANYSTTQTDIPSGSEGYNLTYYYKIFNKETKVEEYQSPKTALKILVSTTDQKQSEEKKTLNNAVLSIPPSYSLIQYGKTEFDKIAATQTGNETSKKAFEDTKEFKEIQEIIKKHDPNLVLSVKSEAKDIFHPETTKIVLLEVTKKAQTESDSTENTSENSEKSQLNFQIRIQKLPETAKPEASEATNSTGSETTSQTSEASSTTSQPSSTTETSSSSSSSSSN